MSQNHWNDNNDQNQIDCTEYTSPNIQNNDKQTQTKKASPQRKAMGRPRRMAAAAAGIMLGLSLCLTAYAMGGLSTDSPQGGGTTVAGDDLPGFETLKGESKSDIAADDGGEYERNVVDSGLTLYDVSNRVTAWRNFKSTRLGAYVVESKYCNEFQYGDYLLSINGISVTSAADAQRICNACAVGDTITVEVVRTQVQEQNGGEQVTETTVAVELTLREHLPKGIYFDTK